MVVDEEGVMTLWKREISEEVFGGNAPVKGEVWDKVWEVGKLDSQCAAALERGCVVVECRLADGVAAAAEVPVAKAVFEASVAYLAVAAE